MKYPTNPSAFTSLAMPSPFLRGACRLLLRSFATFPHLDALFSIVCSLFSKNTWVGGTLFAPSHFLDLWTFGRSDLQTLFCPPFVFTHLQIPSRGTTLFSHPYKPRGCHSVLLSTFDCRLSAFSIPHSSAERRLTLR